MAYLIQSLRTHKLYTLDSVYMQQLWKVYRHIREVEVFDI